VGSIGRYVLGIKCAFVCRGFDRSARHEMGFVVGRGRWKVSL
jgi:hypothetical protein